MITLKEAIILTKDFYKKTNPHNDFDSYEEHEIAVGACASILASACGLDVMKAGIMGYCHDIGKMISDEKRDKTFHGLSGYEYFKSVGEDELAQICLTHTFPNIDFKSEEYLNYGIENMEKAKDILKKLNINDYDRIVQLSDLLVHFDGRTVLYENMKDRMSYIEKEYNVKHHDIRIKYKNAIKLKRYLENKYNCNVYKLLGIK